MPTLGYIRVIAKLQHELIEGLGDLRDAKASLRRARGEAVACMGAACQAGRSAELSALRACDCTARLLGDSEKSKILVLAG